MFRKEGKEVGISSPWQLHTETGRSHIGLQTGRLRSTLLTSGPLLALPANFISFRLLSGRSKSVL